MTDFSMKLAGIPFRVSCLFESTRAFCGEYLTEEQPEFEIQLTREDVSAEREISRQQDLRDGRPVQHFSDPYLETIALYRKLAKPMLSRDCLIFHGAAVAVAGECYLFTAKSGTGKTTHTSLWLKNIPKAYIVNGDKPLIRVADGGIVLYGTPWRGKENYGINASAPLKAIAILERAPENHIEPIGAGEAFRVLYQQTHRLEDPLELARLLGLLERLAKGVRLYRLGCNMEDDAARLAYKTMAEA